MLMQWCRLAGPIALVALAIFAAILLPHSPAGLRDLVLGLGPVAPAIAVAAWILLIPALFPGTVLAAAGGLAFGAAGGAAVAFGGAVAGGLAAFALARIAVRGPIERIVRRTPRLARVHMSLEPRGFATVLAARLMPGVPAGALHYVAGVSPVRARDFAAAIALGALLRTLPYVALGQGLGSGSILAVAFAGGSIALGGLAAIVLVRRVGRPLQAKS